MRERFVFLSFAQFQILDPYMNDSLGYHLQDIYSSCKEILLIFFMNVPFLFKISSKKNILYLLKIFLVRFFQNFFIIYFFMFFIRMKETYKAS